MNRDELEAIKEMHPTALNFWYDRMHEMHVAALIESLLFHMPAGTLLESIYNIEKELGEKDGPAETTE